MWPRLDEIDTSKGARAASQHKREWCTSLTLLRSLGLIPKADPAAFFSCAPSAAAAAFFLDLAMTLGTRPGRIHSTNSIRLQTTLEIERSVDKDKTGLELNAYET